MVSRRIALALLRLASRRWPAAVREDLHRDWIAELHVLASEHRTWAMLRYATSLAVARPVREPVTVAALAGPMWRAFRLAVLAPLTAAVLFLVSMIVMAVVSTVLPTVPFAEDLQFWLWTLLTVGCAVLLARFGRWWTANGAGITALVLAVTVPGFVLSVLMYALSSSSSKLAVHGPAYVVFFGGLAGLLYAVNRLATTGRRVQAWWVGALGALGIADVAVMLPVFIVGHPADGAPHPATAPVWLFTALTNSGFGLPGLGHWEIFGILDVTEFDPQIFLLSTGLALGVIMANSAKTAAAAGLPAPAMP